MAKRKQPEEEIEYEPEEVIDSRIDSKKLIAQFRVKWSGYDSSENTWEPLDNIYKCPMLLKTFTRKKRAALTRSVKGNSSGEAIKQMPDFKKISQEIVNKFRDPLERIPTGCEKVMMFASEKLSDEGNFLWLTWFKNNPRPEYIRKCVACYYWPYEAALFLTNQVHFNAKIKRLTEDS